MTRTLFGTDGIRGRANSEPMTAETALKVAMAAARHFIRSPERHLVVIGKDTRLSGYLIEPALTAGFVSMGMDVMLAGPLPTPAVAMLTRSLRADAGVMISASHNPFEDNGIKLFGPDGYKLSDEIEESIEAQLLAGDFADRAPPAGLGRVQRLDDASGRYIESVKNTFPRGQRLDGLKIVIDCAHGAAYKLAPKVLWELGAEVIAMGIAPDGFNINQGCGAVAPEAMMAEVIARQADIGLALDGDADRLIVADERGHKVDGDQIMALIARRYLDIGMLKGGALVATVMSNLGLERYMHSIGLDLFRAPVGDRLVGDRMRLSGCNVGGEQSGHIILSDYGTTGDGLVAALQVLATLRQMEKPASQALHLFNPVPQKLENIRLSKPAGDILERDSVTSAIRTAEARLQGSGRVLIRKSGTEPLIRVMVEGDDAALVEKVVAEIAAAIKSAA